MAFVFGIRQNAIQRLLGRYILTKRYKIGLQSDKIPPNSA